MSFYCNQICTEPKFMVSVVSVSRDMISGADCMHTINQINRYISQLFHYVPQDCVGSKYKIKYLFHSSEINTLLNLCDLVNLELRIDVWKTQILELLTSVTVRNGH